MRTATLREGQTLMIGVADLSGGSPTPGPSPPDAGTSTATPSSGGTAQVCVLVYDEPTVDALPPGKRGCHAGAAISLTSDDGTYSQTLTSVINPDATVYQGMCFPNVALWKIQCQCGLPRMAIIQR